MNDYKDNVLHKVDSAKEKVNYYKTEMKHKVGNAKVRFSGIKEKLSS